MQVAIKTHNETNISIVPYICLKNAPKTQILALPRLKRKVVRLDQSPIRNIKMEYTVCMTWIKFRILSYSIQWCKISAHVNVVIAATANYVCKPAGLEERVNLIPHKTKITFNWMEIFE